MHTHIHTHHTQTHTVLPPFPLFTYIRSRRLINRAVALRQLSNRVTAHQTSHHHVTTAAAAGRFHTHTKHIADFKPHRSVYSITPSSSQRPSSSSSSTGIPPPPPTPSVVPALYVYKCYIARAHAHTVIHGTARKLRVRTIGGERRVGGEREQE